MYSHLEQNPAGSSEECESLLHEKENNNFFYKFVIKNVKTIFRNT